MMPPLLSPATLSAPAPAEAEPWSSQRLLVILPAFNEQGNVGAVIRDIRAHLPSADVLVVDDGSADGTVAEARRNGARVVSLALNLGYGAALQAGYKYAIRGGYDLVAQIDADGQHSAEYIPPMLRRLCEPEVDVVVGSRFLDRDGQYRPSRARKFGMALFARIASVVMRQPVTDPTSGFQVMGSPVVRFFCSEVYPADYPDADILILLHRSGFQIHEVAVRMQEPDGRKSMHQGHRSLYYIYKMSLSILVTLMRKGERLHGP